MKDSEILECLRRKLAFQTQVMELNERQARQAHARAAIAGRVCEGLAIDIGRLEGRIICPRCLEVSETRLYLGVCDTCNTELNHK